LGFSTLNHGVLCHALAQERGNMTTVGAITPRAAVQPSAFMLTSFVIATLVSSSLLFLVQPLMAKVMLPYFGGSSSVWAVSMSFFQAMLLAGYGYAHLLRKFFSLRQGIVVHIGLMVLGLFLLRFDADALVDKSSETLGALSLLGVLFKSVGFPFAVMSANAPIMQSWFSQSSHKDAADPYFLYAASNLGSMFALLAYPIIIEPLIGLDSQTYSWSAGFLLLTLCLASCGVLLLANQGVSAIEQNSADTYESISWSARLNWLVCAFVPSALLSAWTNHITTDVASVPFLWLPPLALYLASFILMFRAKPWVSIKLLRLLLLISLPVAYAVNYGLGRNYMSLVLVAGAIAFMATACIMHRKMYETRPGSAKLTEFYFVMSLGGVLGGAFVSLIAPMIFSRVTEYPLLLIAALVCAAAIFGKKDVPLFREKWMTFAVLMTGAYLLRSFVGHWYFDNPEAWTSSLLFALLVATFYAFFKTDQRFPAYISVAALMLELMLVQFSSLASYRNFYGVLTVSEQDDRIVMTHGTTIHGAAYVADLDPANTKKPRPLTYYSADGGLAQSVTVSQARLAAKNEKGRFGVVGLGAGSLACYAQSGETWRFFEINEIVTRLAKDPRYFPFLSRCTPEAPIVMGDARLTLQRENKASYDVLIVDAFSSDAIPVHLLTVEATNMYLDLLRPEGVLAIHLSNTHMDLLSVVKANVAALNARGKSVQSIAYAHVPRDNFNDSGVAQSLVMLLSQSPEAIAPYRASSFAHELSETDVRPWTDDYSNVVSSIIRKQRAIFSNLTGP
jgi:hypothetical protein